MISDVHYPSKRVQARESSMSHSNSVVLLVEDNELDIELMQLSLQRCSYPIDCRVVRDGEQCIAFLNKLGPYADAPTPELILLDLNMPRMNGMEVLDAINAAPELHLLPVVVLTTSNQPEDIRGAYARRCSGYVIKPFGYSELESAVRVLMDYWLSLVSLPIDAERLSY